MVKVFDDLLCTINDHKYVLLVLLDLRAAFDTIDHDVLMLHLQKLFGQKGDALKWLRSYFSNRRQCIVIRSRSSSSLPLTTGVPQGSVVGPGTFPAYTKPLGDMVSVHDVNLHL